MKWRSGRDSNPRYAFAVYSLSRRAPSTTRPPLRMLWKAAHLGGARRAGKLAARARPAPMAARHARASDHRPDADEIEAIARARARRAARAVRRAPRATSSCRSRISPTTRLLAEMGIDDPFDLTGLYRRPAARPRKASSIRAPCPTASACYRRADPRRMGGGEREPRASRPPHLGPRGRPSFRPQRRRHARARGARRDARCCGSRRSTCVRGGRLLFEGLDLAARTGRGAARHRTQRQRQVEPDPPRRGPAAAAAGTRRARRGRRWPTTRSRSTASCRWAGRSAFWAGSTALADQALDAMGLAALADVPVRLLSTGQAQARARWRGSSRRARRCGCSTSRSTASMPTASSGSTRRSPAIARAGGAVLAASHRPLGRRLAHAGARPMIARADRPRRPPRARRARPGCRSPSSCWSRRWSRSRSGPTRALLARIGGGALWIAALTAALLPIERLVEPDRADGVLDQLALRGLTEESVAAAKIVAHWLTFAPLAAARRGPGVGCCSALDGRRWSRALIALAVGTPGAGRAGGRRRGADRRPAARRGAWPACCCCRWRCRC